MDGNIKRIFVALGALFALSAGVAVAQERYSARLSYGVVPVTACKGSAGQNAMVEVTFPHSSALPVELSALAGMTWVKPAADFNGIPSRVTQDFAVEALARANFFWHRGRVDLYSGAALGCEGRVQASDRGRKEALRMAYHLTGIGVQTKRRLFISAELGFGHLGVACFGVGYRFGKR